MRFVDFKRLREYSKSIFAKNNIEDVEFDEICERVLHVPKMELFKIVTLKKSQANSILSAVNRRRKGEPISNIFGYAYFYNRKFLANKNVLTPRYDTELLVFEALKYIDKDSNVLDLCTGSGCIGITIALETGADVTCVDISGKALKVAHKNAKNYNCGDLKFLKSNMFENISGRFDVIVSNPPYIKTSDIKTLETEVKNYDPLIALDGGKDGLDFYKKIAEQVMNYLNEHGVLLLEIGFEQETEVTDIFKHIFKDVECVKDLDNLPRVIICKNPIDKKN